MTKRDLSALQCMCPMCRKSVPVDGVHSCYDAAALHVQIKDAERDVLNAAKAYGEALEHDEDEWAHFTDDAHDTLFEAVAALRALERP